MPEIRKSAAYQPLILPTMQCSIPASITPNLVSIAQPYSDFDQFHQHLKQSRVTHVVTHVVTHDVTHVVTHVVTHDVTHVVTHGVTDGITHVVTDDVTDGITHVVTDDVTHGITHDVTHVVTHDITHVVTQDVTHVVIHDPTPPLPTPQSMDLEILLKWEGTFTSMKVMAIPHGVLDQNILYLVSTFAGSLWSWWMGTSNKQFTQGSRTIVNDCLVQRRVIQWIIGSGVSGYQITLLHLVSPRSRK